MTLITRFILIIVAMATSFTAYADGKFVLVIDAGHGGNDSGCVGKTAKEKDITLSVAKLLKQKIEKAYPDQVEVVMTRDNDKFVELKRRADIANRAHGNLFMSIHVNSVDKRNKKRSTVAGAQVYTCGLHRNQNNLEVAMRENSVLELEADYSTTYQGFDPDSSESYIMFEMAQNRYQQQSLQMAEMAQNQLVNYAGRANKEIHQAGFWVLWATAMPSVLVELDFICNPTQEKFLASKGGQEKCAEALFRAFKQYYKKQSKSK